MIVVVAAVAPRRRPAPRSIPGRRHRREHHAFSSGATAGDVVTAHPLGIGRGAFDRVFPIYRTLLTGLADALRVRRKRALQMLIDCGWIFLCAVLLAAIGVCCLADRPSRVAQDKVEAALVGGHRSRFSFTASSTSAWRRSASWFRSWPCWRRCWDGCGRRRHGTRRASSGRSPRSPALACSSASLSVAHGSYDDFDALLKRRDRRGDEARARSCARSGPIPPTTSTRWPTPGCSRSRRRGRAFAAFSCPQSRAPLCPSCEAIHVEVARNLWSLGLRRQALLEWRSAVDIQPSSSPALGELFAAGAKPEELAAIADLKANRMIDVANFLSSVSRLDQAIRVSRPSGGSRRVAARAANHPREVRAARRATTCRRVSAREGARRRDPRSAPRSRRCGVASAGKRRARPDQALAVLDAAAAQIQVIWTSNGCGGVVLKYRKWQPPRARSRA